MSNYNTLAIVSMASTKSQTNQQINTIRPKNNSYSNYLYLYLSNSSMTKYLQDLASGGSATLNLNTSNFSKIKIIKPSDELLNIFYSNTATLFEKIMVNSLENKSLEQIRDTLLPKLLNGEL